MFKRVLFYTDFSPEAAAAFDYALGIAEACGTEELVLFHVIPEPEAQFWRTYIYELPDVDEKAKKDIDERFRADYLSRVPPGLAARIRVVVGSDDAAILQAVKDEEADLLIMCRKGHGKAPSILFGDSVKTAVHKAHCPVLVVPEPS